MSATMQARSEGHATDESEPFGSSSFDFQAEAPPSGDVLHTTSLELSIPTHRPADGHSRSVSGAAAARAFLHAPRRRWLDHSTLPLSSNAKHSPVLWTADPAERPRADTPCLPSPRRGRGADLDQPSLPRGALFAVDRDRQAQPDGRHAVSP